MIKEPKREANFLDEMVIRRHIPFLEEHKEELVVLGNPAGIRWIGTYWQGENHILGPITEKKISVTDMRQVLPAELTVRYKEIAGLISKIPVILNNLFLQYAIMFYYALTGNKTEIGRSIFASDVQQDTLNQDPDETEENLRNCWSCEKEMYDVVKNGQNVDFQKMLSKYGKIVLRKVYPVDSLRNQKSLGLHLLTLSVHAAIEGGQPLSTGYALQAHYIRRIEECRDTSAVSAVDIELFEEFARRVHNLQIQRKDSSRFLMEVQDYIKLRPEEDISLKRLAEQFHYTEYYLSRKFKEECGMRINEYIRQQKLERAAFLLKNTDYTVSRISEMLNFSSVSYFISEFRKRYGRTPVDFRNQAG